MHARAQMEEFAPEAVSKVSKACTSICMWVRAMYVYHNVALQVRPHARAVNPQSACVGLRLHPTPEL